MQIVGIIGVAFLIPGYVRSAVRRECQRAGIRLDAGAWVDLLKFPLAPIPRGQFHDVRCIANLRMTLWVYLNPRKAGRGVIHHHGEPFGSSGITESVPDLATVFGIAQMEVASLV